MVRRPSRLDEFFSKASVEGEAFLPLNYGPPLPDPAAEKTENLEMTITLPKLNPNEADLEC